MAKRAGGYRKSDDVEWAECHRTLYGEAIVSAAAMGQDVYTWLNDAIAFHAYQCERLRLYRQYRDDQEEATHHRRPAVDPNEARYQPTRPKPEITWPARGQGSRPGSEPRPCR
jgi:hypothetical protein